MTGHDVAEGYVAPPPPPACSKLKPPDALPYPLEI